MKKSKSHQSESTNKKILKVMGVFTGVEFFGILCSMVKMKIIAEWLKAYGLGLLNIFNTTVETTTFLTGLGLRQSSVREIARERGRGLPGMHRVVRIVRSWSLVAALIGGCGLTALSWPLAEIIFDKGEMWWNFVILGGAVMLNAIFAGESAIFQASEEFKRLAKAGVYGAFVGLIISIPLFYYLGDHSVSISIAVYSLTTLIAAILLRNRNFDSSKPSGDVLKEGMEMVRFGVWISISSFFNSLCQLVFLTWLNREASPTEVGFYAAGITLVVRYTALVFNSVSLEFYPRIASCHENPRRIGIYLNHEINLLLMLFTPLFLLFLIFRRWIVLLLYTPEFLVILPFITWGIALILFRAVSNTMAMCILAKGEGKVYMLTETADALFGLGLSIWMYYLWGLSGLGVALLAWHLSYMILVAIICRIRFRLHLNREAIRTILITFLTAALSILLVFRSSEAISIPLMGIGAIIYFRIFFSFLRRRHKSRTPLNQSVQ